MAVEKWLDVIMCNAQRALVYYAQAPVQLVNRVPLSLYAIRYNQHQSSELMVRCAAASSVLPKCLSYVRCGASLNGLVAKAVVRTAKASHQ